MQAREIHKEANRKRVNYVDDGDEFFDLRSDTGHIDIP